MAASPKSLGFTRREFAARVRLGEAAISDNTSGRPGKVNALWSPLMEALQLMTPEMRAQWLAEDHVD